MKRRRRPVMGFFAGLFLGLGIALILFVFGIVPLSVVWLGALVAGGIVLGIILGFVLPRGSRGPKPPVTEGAAPAPA